MADEHNSRCRAEKPVIFSRIQPYGAAVSRKITTGSLRVCAEHTMKEGRRHTNHPARSATQGPKRIFAARYTRTTVRAPRKQLNAAAGSLAGASVMKNSAPTKYA